jgi:integrase
VQDRIVYDVRFRDATKAHRRTFDDVSLAMALEASVKAAKARAKLDGEPFVFQEQAPRKAQTFNQFVESFWQDYAKVEWSERTRQNRASVFNCHLEPFFGLMVLDKIDVRTVQAFKAQAVQKSGQGAVRRALELLSVILTTAVRWGEADSNPCLLVKKPKAKRKRVVRPLSPAQVEDLRYVIRQPMPVMVPAGTYMGQPRSAYERAEKRDEWTRMRDAALVSVLAYGGLRPGEALALEWDDVDSRINVTKALDVEGTKDTKTEVDRRVALLSPLADDLAAWREHNTCKLVFPASKAGEAFSENGYKNWARRTFKRACERSGIKLVPYDLRHSCASLLLAEGRNLVAVAKTMGHSVQVLSDVYAAVIEDLPEERIDATAEIRSARERHAVALA